MTVAPPLPRTAVPAPRLPLDPATVGLTPPRRRWRDRLREHAALRREERAFAHAMERAPTPSARAELRTLREYAR